MTSRRCSRARRSALGEALRDSGPERGGTLAAVWRWRTCRSQHFYRSGRAVREDDVTVHNDQHEARRSSRSAPHVGGFAVAVRAADSDALASSPRGAARDGCAVSKLMRNQDLVQVARRCRVVTRFRCTIGLPGRLSVRLQPNHPTDDARGIAASILDGLLYGCGDAVIGINPAGDGMAVFTALWRMLDGLISRFAIPTQSCVLTHVTNQIRGIESGAPVDLVFQSVGGTQKTNEAFGITLKLLEEGRDAARSLKRGTLGDNVMYFETGQGSSLSAGAHWNCDQQTIEARATVGAPFEPLTSTA